MKKTKKRKEPASTNLNVDIDPTEKPFNISPMMTLVKLTSDEHVLFNNRLNQAIEFFWKDKLSNCYEILDDIRFILDQNKDFAYLLRLNLWKLIVLIKIAKLNIAKEPYRHFVESSLTLLSKLFALFFRHYQSAETEQIQLQRIFLDLLQLQNVNLSQTDRIDLYGLLFNQVTKKMLKIDYFLCFTFNLLILESRKNSEISSQKSYILINPSNQNNQNFSLSNHQLIMDTLINYLFKQSRSPPMFHAIIYNNILAIINRLKNISDLQKVKLNSLEIIFSDLDIPTVINKCHIIIKLLNQIIQSKQDPISSIPLINIITFVSMKLDYLDQLNFNLLDENFFNIKMEFKALKLHFCDVDSNFIYISDLINNQKFEELKYIFSRTVHFEKILEITERLIPCLHKLFDSPNPDLFFYLKYYILLRMNPDILIDRPELKEALHLVIPDRYIKIETVICDALQKQRDLIFYIESNLFFFGAHTIHTMSSQQSLYIPAVIRPSIALFSIDNIFFKDIPFYLLEKISNPSQYIPSQFSYLNVAVHASHSFAIHYTSGPLENRSMNQLKSLIHTHLIATLKNPICLNKSFRFALYQVFIRMALAGKYPNTNQIKDLINEVKEKDEQVHQTMSHLSFKIGDLLFKNTGLKQLNLYIYKLSLELSILWINSCKGLSIDVLIKKLQLTAERIAGRIIALSHDPSHSGQTRSVSKGDYGHVSLLNFKLYKRADTTHSKTKSEIKAFPITLRGEDLTQILLETPSILPSPLI